MLVAGDGRIGSWRNDVLSEAFAIHEDFTVLYSPKCASVYFRAKLRYVYARSIAKANRYWFKVCLVVQNPLYG